MVNGRTFSLTYEAMTPPGKGCLTISINGFYFTSARGVGCKREPTCVGEVAYQAVGVDPLEAR